MKEAKLLDRREFTLAAAMAVLSGVAITISGCAGGSSYSASPVAPTSPTQAVGDKTGSVSDNHGHSAVIASAQCRLSSFASTATVCAVCSSG